jgi:hypothetical protein
MAGEYRDPSDYVRTREFDRAVQFLSEKIDAGFKVTHDKQDTTNGRLLRAERAIIDLQKGDAVETAVEQAEEKARERMATWKVTAFSTLGTSALGGLVWVFRKVLGL